MFVILIIVFTTFSPISQGSDKTRPVYATGELSFEDKLYRNRQVSKKYVEGRFLVYDCTDDHFACVNRAGFENCLRQREIAIQSGQFFLPCGPLKEEVDLRSCVARLDGHLSGLFNRAFCRYSSKVLTFERNEND